MINTSSSSLAIRPKTPIYSASSQDTKTKIIKELAQKVANALKESGPDRSKNNNTSSNDFNQQHAPNLSSAPNHPSGYPQYPAQYASSGYPQYPAPHGPAGYPQYPAPHGPAGYPQYPAPHGPAGYPQYPAQYASSGYPQYPAPPNNSSYFPHTASNNRPDAQRELSIKDQEQKAAKTLNEIYTITESRYFENKLKADKATNNLDKINKCFKILADNKESIIKAKQARLAAKGRKIEAEHGRQTAQTQLLELQITQKEMEIKVLEASDIYSKAQAYTKSKSQSVFSVVARIRARKAEAAAGRTASAAEKDRDSIKNKVTEAVNKLKKAKLAAEQTPQELEVLESLINEAKAKRKAELKTISHFATTKLASLNNKKKLEQALKASDQINSAPKTEKGLTYSQFISSLPTHERNKYPRTLTVRTKKFTEGLAALSNKFQQKKEELSNQTTGRVQKLRTLVNKIQEAVKPKTRSENLQKQKAYNQENSTNKTGKDQTSRFASSPSKHEQNKYPRTLRTSVGKKFVNGLNTLLLTKDTLVNKVQEAYKKYVTVNEEFHKELHAKFLDLHL